MDPSDKMTAQREAAEFGAHARPTQCVAAAGVRKSPIPGATKARKVYSSGTGEIGVLSKNDSIFFVRKDYLLSKIQHRWKYARLGYIKVTCFKK